MPGLTLTPRATSDLRLDTVTADPPTADTTTQIQESTHTNSNQTTTVAFDNNEPSTSTADEPTYDQQEIDTSDTIPTRRSTRERKPPQQYTEFPFMAHAALQEPAREFDYVIQEDMTDPIAFAAKSDPDTLYLGQAMKAPDRDQFIKAMETEVNAHSRNEHWELIPKSSVPNNKQVIPAVWAMKRKRRISTREVYKLSLIHI